VKLVTVGAYDNILKDFQDKSIDAAFLGSLVATLAMDRYGAKVLAKPELTDGTSTYHGVLITRTDSPIHKVADMSGRSLAMVRTTTAGDLYPCYLLFKQGMMAKPKQPRFVWVGTHDDAVRAVVEKRLEAGAVKNIRLDALLRENPEWRIRRLAEGGDVPNNGLVVRGEIAQQVGAKLRGILLGMAQDRDGLEVLKAMGARRFLPCEQAEYAAIYDMVEALGPAWPQVGIAGPPPRRPAKQP